MKFITSLILAFFVLSAADIPFEVLQKNAVKSCCCSAGSVCRCQHGGVSMCPMKKMKEAQAAEEKLSHCQLQRAKALKKDAEKAVEKAESAGMPIFKAFGCGSSEEHKAAPTYSRDFTLELQPQGLAVLANHFFSAKKMERPLPQISYPIEKPPQISFFSI